MQTTFQPGIHAPRPTAFSAVVFSWMGLSAVLLVLAFINIGNLEQNYAGSMSWLPTYGLLDAAVGISMLFLLWCRQKWAFFVLCAQTAIGLVLGLMINTPKFLLLVSPIMLGLLFWSLHVGGMTSMWRQMFGAPPLPGGRRGFAGMQPAMPPGVPPVKSSMPPSTPPPAPPPAQPSADDPFEQIKKLAALRVTGVITIAEFEAKKSELLKRL